MSITYTEIKDVVDRLINSGISSVGSSTQNVFTSGGTGTPGVSSSPGVGVSPGTSSPSGAGSSSGESTSINTSSTMGPSTGVYLPAQKARAKDGSNYVDVSKTLNDSTLKSLASANGGLYPITFYTKPGDPSGTKYAKVVNFEGARNVYEANPAFQKNLVKWSYKGSNGFTKSATVNKLWSVVLTEIAKALDNAGMWNSAHIKSWDAGILRRDVTPKGVIYGKISAHAFGMAIDINSREYPLRGGKAIWDKDFANRVPTALVHDFINRNFVKTQGGSEKVFWLYPSDVHHFSVYKKV